MHWPIVVVLHCCEKGQHHVVAGGPPSEHVRSAPLAQTHELPLHVDPPVQISQLEPHALLPSGVHVFGFSGQQRSLTLLQQLAAQRWVVHDKPASGGATHVPYEGDPGTVSH